MTLNISELIKAAALAANLETPVETEKIDACQHFEAVSNVLPAQQQAFNGLSEIVLQAQSKIVEAGLPDFSEDLRSYSDLTEFEQFQRKLYSSAINTALTDMGVEDLGKFSNTFVTLSTQVSQNLRQKHFYEVLCNSEKTANIFGEINQDLTGITKTIEGATLGLGGN